MKTTEQIEHDKNLRRVVVSSLVGAVIEWYDFFLYGVVAGLIFNHLYFPEFDDRIGTMLAFATFAVGFVARPLGGLSPEGLLKLLIGPGMKNLPEDFAPLLCFR